MDKAAEEARIWRFILGKYPAAFFILVSTAAMRFSCRPFCLLSALQTLSAGEQGSPAPLFESVQWTACPVCVDRRQPEGNGTTAKPFNAVMGQLTQVVVDMERHHART